MLFSTTHTSKETYSFIELDKEKLNSHLKFCFLTLQTHIFFLLLFYFVGAPLKNEMVQISPNISATNTAELIWICQGDPIRQETIFRYILFAIKTFKISNWLLCNSFYELDPLACDLIPNLLPIGPLLSSAFRENQLETCTMRT